MFGLGVRAPKFCSLDGLVDGDETFECKASTKLLTCIVLDVKKLSD